MSKEKFITCKHEAARRKEFVDLEQTNWWIVTGGPSTGKTTLLEHLVRRGYKSMPEAARVYIDEQIALGKTIEEIRADETAFQVAVLRMKEKIEDETPINELVLWDRGLHGDSMAYWKQPLQNAVKPNQDDMFEPEIVTVQKRLYKGIFLLDRLPSFQKDYARVEDEKQATWIHSAIEQMYRLLGYEPIKVSVMP